MCVKMDVVSKQFARVICRTHTTVAAPFKASGTSDILIHAVIPAAVRYDDCTRNHCCSLSSDWVSILKAEEDCQRAQGP